MGLRPKTARRLTLIGVFLSIVVFGGIAVLTVPKWQRGRQIESFKRDGLRAHQEGRHHVAVPLLNRHTKAVGEENAAPEVLLSLARSQAELEARRDNHINVAVSRFRAYLRLVPDDIGARRELLSLLVEGRRWDEAVDLAERINTDLTPGSEEEIQALRDEWAAQVRENPDSQRVGELETVLLGAEPPEFRDVWEIYRYRVSEQGFEPSIPILGAYSAAWPDELGASILKYIEPIAVNPGDPETAYENRPLAEVVADITERLGLDSDTTTPGAVEITQEGLPGMLAGWFDNIGRADYAAEVLSQSLVGEHASENRNRLARRLYWGRAFDALFALDIPDDRRDSVIDAMGYQALAALTLEDDERANALQRELETVEYSFRAKSWLDVLNARRALTAQDLPAARSVATEAVERYENEPTFRLLLGEIQYRMGFPTEALREWELASLAAGSYAWAEPVIRRISTLFENSRQLDARDLLNEYLENDRYAALLDMRQLSLTVNASMFLQGLISEREAIEAAIAGETLRSQIPEDAKALLGLGEIDLALATIYGELGEPKEAARALSRVLETPDAAEYLAEIRSIDARYQLGLAASQGQPVLPESMDDPVAARQLAMAYVGSASVDEQNDAAREQRIDETLAWIDSNAARVDTASAPGWLGARARFLEELRPEEAESAWRAAVEAAPDDLKLLQDVVRSDVLGQDLAFVDATIDQIRVLTSSQGRTLPASLRLARAIAVFGPDPDRMKRDEAIGIVRSVVAAEPRNTEARLVLGNMLSAECSPTHKAPDARFEPDLDSAIAQFQSIAGQIQGEGAVPYYFEIIDLANRTGDDDRALRAVRDALNVIGSDARGIEAIALAFRDSGDREASARILNAHFEQVAGPARVRAGLVLAETYAMLGEDAQAAVVLRSLADSSELSAEQVSEIAIRLTQNGAADRAEQLLADANGFGISERELNTIRATLLARFSSLQTATAGLDRIVQTDPENVEAWETLVYLLVDADDREAAGDRVEAALAANPGNESIQFLQAYVAGDFGSLADLVNLDSSAPEVLRLALEEIDGFEQNRDSQTRVQQIETLRSLASRFSNIAPVQNYAMRERELLGEDMGVLVEDVVSAARAFPDQPTLLSVATRASLAVNRYEDALNFATRWRGFVEGSRLEPDLYAAEAVQGLGLDERAIDLVEPYLAGVLASPNQPLHTAALVIHGASSMRTGRASEVRSLYGPLAASNPGFRAAVWITLGSRWAPDGQAAFEWLDTAEQWGTDEIESALAQGWIDAAQRYEDRRAEMLQRALAAADLAIARNPSDAQVMVLRAGALRGLSLVEPDAGSDWLARAEVAYVDADRIDPSNLNLLFQAARSAEDDERHADAERHYRELLERPEATGLFAAVIRNNIAMSIVRQGDDAISRISEAAAMIETALETQSVPAFFGTRGWVRLRAGDLDGAAGDFARHTQSNPENALSWAGRALSDQGEARESAKAAWQRALEFGLDEEFAIELAEEAELTSE